MMPTAAGILFIKDGQALVLKRAPSADDHPNTWGLPGGGIEDGEDAPTAAAREAMEEIGVTVDPASLREIANDGHFVTHISPWPDGADVTLNDEHVGHQWVRGHDITAMADDLHPGLREMFDRPSTNRLLQMGQTETDVMQAIRDGILPSPQRFANMWLYALRITGTGIAVRNPGDPVEQEVTWRDPAIYLTEEFMARCNGLPVITLHTDAPALTSQEFAERIVGTSAMPYIEGDEVWTIARIYDKAIGELLNTNQLSTSPNVVFLDKTKNSTITLADGTPVLVEGNPELIDHLAICMQGVWDKGGQPAGVKSDNLGATEMADDNSAEEAKKQEEAAASAAAAKKDSDEAPPWAKAFMDSVSSIASRMDALEGKNPAAEEKPGAAVAHVVKPDDEKAAQEAQARADAEAALNNRVDGVETALAPLSDDEADAMADAQNKADSVAHALGMPAHATRAFLGEKPTAYRLRMSRKLQVHSPAYKEVNLAAIASADTKAFSIAEAAIYADAAQVANRPAEVSSGHLRAVTRRDSSGREITEFVGDSRAAWGPFIAPSRKASGFNKEA